MFRALLLKELRENVPLVALVALGIIYALAELTGWTVIPGLRFTPDFKIPFVYDTFPTIYAVVIGGFAAVLGLKQSAWEEFRGTYHYVLFRPLSWPQIVAAKLAVGIGLVQAAAALLIVLYALWALTPGKIAAPFYWSMTSDAWRAWLVFPAVYLAAFLSGIRPARWYATRLAPLAAGGAALALGLALQAWWSLALVGSAILSLLLVACILNVATSRDY